MQAGYIATNVSERLLVSIFKVTLRYDATQANYIIQCQRISTDLPIIPLKKNPPHVCRPTIHYLLKKSHSANGLLS